MGGGGGACRSRGLRPQEVGSVACRSHVVGRSAANDKHRRGRGKRKESLTIDEPQSGEEERGKSH